MEPTPTPTPKNEDKRADKAKATNRVLSMLSAKAYIPPYIKDAIIFIYVYERPNEINNLLAYPPWPLRRCWRAYLHLVLSINDTSGLPLNDLSDRERNLLTSIGHWVCVPDAEKAEILYLIIHTTGELADVYTGRRTIPQMLQLNYKLIVQDGEWEDTKASDKEAGNRILRDDEDWRDNVVVEQSEKRPSGKDASLKRDDAEDLVGSSMNNPIVV